MNISRTQPQLSTSHRASKSQHHCGRFASFATRREWLRRSACGFGSIAAGALLGKSSLQASANRETTGGIHHAARAKSVIFLYMDGGVSQVDSFDPKPRLDSDG
ncbi:MAG: DUF1501 domain-containing protein, partial [Planctomycetaceae bacterium]